MAEGVNKEPPPQGSRTIEKPVLNRVMVGHSNILFWSEENDLLVLIEI